MRTKIIRPDLLEIAMEHSESLIINARACDEYTLVKIY
ncbi:hypothetical protein MNBD_BACTEROID06-1679 [hydrothermal vent metagenome]|uniref:Uncharacterized protein n=1 Tax=hydrothermal vent metagenome TaxID=652676 RepID=A0A3B0V2L9_9ZZZZ